MQPIKLLTERFRCFIVGAFVLSIPISVNAASTLIGHGNRACAFYNETEKSAPEIHSSFEIWVVGYLSGINAVTNMMLKEKDFLAEPEKKEIVAFLKGYCLANPNRTVANAANAYFYAKTGR